MTLVKLLALAFVTAAAVPALTPARFAGRPGWHVGAGKVQTCPGVPAWRCSSVTSWAATVPWRDCANCLPHKTLARLPRDGIAMQLSIGRERPRSWERPLRWPPRLRANEANNFEGLPTRIGTIQRIGRLHGFTVYFFVFFGRPRPTQRQLERAEAELASARLP
jgi:hypothetical protein